MRSSMGLQRTDHTIDAQQGYSTRADGMALQRQALQTLADTHAHTKWARASPSHAHSISIVSKDSAVAQATPPPKPLSRNKKQFKCASR